MRPEKYTWLGFSVSRIPSGYFVLRTTMDTCSTCRFWRDGTCRRRSPNMSGWPPAERTDWCGEFEAKKSKQNWKGANWKPPDGFLSVYMVRCGDGTLYVGSSSQLAKRIEQHATGKGARYTRARLPIELVFVLPGIETPEKALRIESTIKSLSEETKEAMVQNWLSSRPCATTRPGVPSLT